MQDTDIEDLLETHGQYFANMTSTYYISKHSTFSYGSLVTGKPMVAYKELMFMSWKEQAEKYL